MLSLSKMDPNISTKGQWLYASPLQLENSGLQANWFLRTVAACQFLINFVFQLRECGCMPALEYSALKSEDSGCMPVLIYAELEPEDSGCMPVCSYANLECKGSGCMPVLIQAALEPKEKECVPVLILIYFSVAVCQGKCLRV